MEEKGLIPSEDLKKLPQEVAEKTLTKDYLLNVHDEMMKLIPLAGTIEIDGKQKEILFGHVKKEDIEIRPDGLVYLPWPYYVERLNKAFGISWAIIPKDMPKLQGNHMYWPFYLMIQGKLAGFAIGEQEYQPNNAMMSYSDASEGAKSNCLMRLCKNLGISLELWKPSFVKEWKDEFAEEYYDERKKKKLWRKKGQVVSESNEVKKEDAPEPVIEVKDSENMTAGFIERLGKVGSVVDLKTLWDEINKNMKNMSPEHYQELVKIKDKLKEKLQ